MTGAAGVRAATRHPTPSSARSRILTRSSTRRADQQACTASPPGRFSPSQRSAGPQDAGAQLRQTPLWPLFEAVAPTLAYDAATMGDSAVPAEQAAAVTIPLLALAGGASPAWMQQAARAVADAAPNERYGLLE